MHGAVAPVVQVAAGELEAKLGLAEFLLASTDLQESARRAVDWLVAQTPIKHAVVVLCRSVEPSAGHRRRARCLQLRHRRLRPDPRRRSASADQGDAPARADLLRQPAAVVQGAARAGVSTPSRCAATTAIRRCGLLLTSAAAPELRPEVTWLAGLLSKQVARLLSRDTLAETRFGQERMLLYSIINAVTDPILLTDTEGKLIIANSHAEKLFAAPEDASEGWRRAVALNNMLFSAALSTSAVAESELARRELLLVDPLEGSDLLFELLSSRAKDERQGTYVVSILRNVTDLARAKEEIEESYRTLRVAQAEVRDERHRLELIIDSVADPILVTDQEGDIVLMNAPAERLFNVPGIGGRGGAAAGARQRREPHVVRLERADRDRRAALPRRDPADRSGHRAAAAGRRRRRHDPVGAGRADVGRHDPARPDRSDREGAALRAAEAGVGGARAQGPGSDGGAGGAERAAAAAAHRARAGVGAEVAVPRQHVARVPDAAQRDPGLHAHAAERRHRRGHRSAAQEPDAHRLELAPPARAHQRHPRHHPHRGGPDAAEPVDASASASWSTR